VVIVVLGDISMWTCYINKVQFSYSISVLILRQNIYGVQSYSALYKARFQVLTAASMKMAAAWDIAPSSVVAHYRHFGDAYCLHHQGVE
jgi:hypothetical protein